MEFGVNESLRHRSTTDSGTDIATLARRHYGGGMHCPSAFSF